MERRENPADIVGSLPFELLLEVVEYLKPEDIVRSQMVCVAFSSAFNRHDGLIRRSTDRGHPRFQRNGSPFSRLAKLSWLSCAGHWSS